MNGLEQRKLRACERIWHGHWPEPYTQVRGAVAWGQSPFSTIGRDQLPLVPFFRGRRGCGARTIVSPNFRCESKSATPGLRSRPWREGSRRGCRASCPRRLRTPSTPLSWDMQQHVPTWFSVAAPPCALYARLVYKAQAIGPRLARFSGLWLPLLPPVQHPSRQRRPRDRWPAEGRPQSGHFMAAGLRQESFWQRIRCGPLTKRAGGPRRPAKGFRMRETVVHRRHHKPPDYNFHNYLP